MNSGRRRFFRQTLSCLTAFSCPLWPAALWAQAGHTLAGRLADTMREYSEQGIHRAGNSVDYACAQWMVQRLADYGVPARLEETALVRVDVTAAQLQTQQFSEPGVPVYDASFTDASGVTGTLGLSGSAADIGVVMLPESLPRAPYEPLELARRQMAHRALLVISPTGYPAAGVAVMNAPHTASPYGPPVLQIAHERYHAIQQLMQDQHIVTLVAHAQREPVIAHNVTARISGRRPGLPPVVVMTSRSGWWQAAAERSGGIALLLELAREFVLRPPDRDVIFIADTGAETGQPGLHTFVQNNPSLVTDAAIWIELGGNFAARGAVIRLEYSDYEVQEVATQVLDSYRMAADVETPAGSPPLGQLRHVFEGGGRFLSLSGTNSLLAHPDDVWPAAVDIDATTAWSQALLTLVRNLASA